MHRRKVCVVTGSRAEYGLLYWLLRDIREEHGLELQLLVTGMHLSPEFGMTVREIEADGLPIAERIEMLLSSDSPAGITKAIGVGVIGFADAFARLRPDIVVLLGDRFEILAAAQAAMVATIPIAHIHGGEVTHGAIDDAMRHSLTKMSHYHFVSAEPFRRRVIQLGEAPERVVVVGAPGLDHLRRTELMDRAELEASLGFQLRRPALLVTYHPATLAGVHPSEPMRELLAALDRSQAQTVVFTRPNADTHGRVINGLIDEFLERHPDRAHAFSSLGQKRYLSALRHVDAVVGNSSSGIIEAPAVPVATVNVGMRQGGRLRAKTVIDCAEKRGEMEAAIARAISPEFRDECVRGATSPYGDGQASQRILRHLKEADLDHAVRKRFFDVDFTLE
jgi:UDP-hydrolysing UDP-N-acetyl-D-glucosamine 2-epimerase